MINHLVRRGAELFAAGDDDQSIYGFRHANPDGIRNFSTIYAPAETPNLTICKRSAKEVLDIAEFVANQDLNRIKKELKAEDESKVGVVEILRFNSQYEEANSLAKLINFLIYKKGIEPKKILILLRSDYNKAFSKPIKEELKLFNIQANEQKGLLQALNCPVSEKTNTKLTGGRKVLSILRLLENMHDNFAWHTIILIDINGVGIGTIKKIIALAEASSISFSECIQQIKIGSKFILNQSRRLIDAIEKVDLYISSFPYQSTLSINEIIEKVCRDWISDVQERDYIIDIFNKIASDTQSISVSEVLKKLSSIEESLEPANNENSVNLMTMHKAKGLTADVVVVVAAEEEYIPGRDELEARDDARRLLYVALTRARDFLIITHCNQRLDTQINTGGKKGTRSRNLTSFLRDYSKKTKPGSAWINKEINENSDSS